MLICTLGHIKWNKNYYLKCQQTRHREEEARCMIPSNTTSKTKRVLLEESDMNKYPFCNSNHKLRDQSDQDLKLLFLRSGRIYLPKFKNRNIMLCYFDPLLLTEQINPTIARGWQERSDSTMSDDWKSRTCFYGWHSSFSIEPFGPDLWVSLHPKSPLRQNVWSSSVRHHVSA